MPSLDPGQDEGAICIHGRLYPLIAPKKYRCKMCGFRPMQIGRFVWYQLDKNGRKKEYATPVLICDEICDDYLHRGCGSFFSLEEYGLVPKDLEVKDD